MNEALIEILLRKDLHELIDALYQKFSTQTGIYSHYGIYEKTYLPTNTKELYTGGSFSMLCQDEFLDREPCPCESVRQRLKQVANGLLIEDNIRWLGFLYSKHSDSTYSLYVITQPERRFMTSHYKTNKQEKWVLQSVFSQEITYTIPEL